MTNVFWKEVIQTWIFYREITNINQNSVIPNTVIWSSGHIKNNNLLLKRNYYMQKGLIYLKNIYNYNENTFKTKEMLQQEYGIDITFFDHFA